MAITRVQTAEGTTLAPAVTPLSTSNFSSGSTDGNLIVVFVGWYSPSAQNISSVTDTLGTTYTEVDAVLNGTLSHGMAVYYGVLASSGTNAVSVNFSAAVNYASVFAVEYSSGGGAWSLDTGVVDEWNDGDLDLHTSTPISTANAEELVVLGAHQVQSSTYTAGTDFTLIDGSIGDSLGVAEYITSSTLSSYIGHMTSGSSTLAGFLGIAAFKYTATGQFARPASDVADGNWLNSKSPTPDNVDLFDYINEDTADDDDYIRSGATPSNDTCTVGLSSIGTPDAGTVTIRVRAKTV